ncbi:MAG: hypothetical protein V1647_07190 [Pseudomonadota bacterium]
MGNINSLKGIILFGLRNGYREVHFEDGKLPLLISGQGERTYLQGVMPTGKEAIFAIRRDYLSGADRMLITFSGQEFLISDLGNELIFRHLPNIEQPLNTDPELSSACYSRKGMILVVSNEQEKRALDSYKTASYIVNNRKITLCIIEKNKFYGLKSSASKIINIYKPDASLDVLLRATEDLICDCVMIPNCNTTDSIWIANTMAYDKLVIAGTTAELASNVDEEILIYKLDVNRRDTLYTRTTPRAILNTDVLSQNTRG